MMKKIFVLTSLIIGFLGGFSQKANANYMYGDDSVSRQLVVDKQVISDQGVFVAEDKIDFKVVVKNSGDEELRKIEVIDYSPNFINFISGPEGFSQDGNKISWEIDGLVPGEEKTFSLGFRVVGSNELSGKNKFCLINKVNVRAETGESDEDSEQFCIEPRVLGAKVLPEAGAELFLGIFASLSLVGVGFFKKR